VFCRHTYTLGILGVALCRRLHTHICSVLQCVAVCCSELQCFAVCCSALQCVAVCCSVLQCVAGVLQCVAHTYTQFILKYEQPTRKRCAFYNTQQSMLNATDFCSQRTFPSCICCLFIELGANHTCIRCNTQLHTARHRNTHVRLVCLLPLYLVPLSPPRQPLNLLCSIQRLLMVCAIDPGMNGVAVEQQFTSLLRLVLLYV